MRCQAPASSVRWNALRAGLGHWASGHHEDSAPGIHKQGRPQKPAARKPGVGAGQGAWGGWAGEAEMKNRACSGWGSGIWPSWGRAQGGRCLASGGVLGVREENRAGCHSPCPQGEQWGPGGTVPVMHGPAPSMPASSPSTDWHILLFLQGDCPWAPWFGCGCLTGL